MEAMAVVVDDAAKATSSKKINPIRVQTLTPHTPGTAARSIKTEQIPDIV